MKAVAAKCTWIGLVGVAALVAVGWWWLAPEGPSVFFEDKTPGSGLDFTYRNGEEADRYTILESLGGGVGLIDYDQDGLLDVFVAGGGHFEPNKEILGYPNRLYRNLGGWRFRDVTAEVGLPTDGVVYSHGCAVGDYDNDGWPDLLVTGYGRMALYRNRGGKFEDVTAKVGLHDQRPLHWSTSAAWGDLNGDGFLDLFVCHYVDWSFANDPNCKSPQSDRQQDVCPPEKFQPLLPAVFLSNGSGVFQHAGARAGLVPGNGMGVLILDLNDDGKLDVYVANDGGGNRLYLNRGAGEFEESAIQRGVAYSLHGQDNGSMGIAAGDYNRSGLPSLFVTNFQKQNHCLYRNLGGSLFQNAEQAAGLLALGQDQVGFGAGFVDLDLDGSEDLIIAQGHVLRHPLAPSTFKQRPVLLRNLHKQGDKPGQTRFDIVTDRGGPYFRAAHMGRGMALGDLDNDGAVDIVISNTNEAVTLLRNRAASQANWLGIELTGEVCRDPVGAKLTLEVGGQTLTRFVVGGGSYLSSSDRRVVFGLGQAQAVEKLTVRWPSGRSQIWDGKELPTRRYHKLVEGGRGDPKR